MTFASSFSGWLASKGIVPECSVLGVALDLAIKGVHVFPVLGKVPAGKLVPHGVLDATDDARQVVRWFYDAPDLGVGLAIGVGAFEGVRVLDTDPRHGGDVRVRELEAKHGPLPPTLTVVTGRGDGGSHRYFMCPAGSYRKTPLGKDAGVDFIGRGGYAVGPKSPHPDTGRTYEVIVDCGIAWAPSWLVELARVKEDPAPRVAAPSSTDVVARARAYLAKCEPAISGAHGHDTTFGVALKLVRGFGLDVDTAYALMADWNAACQPPWSARDLRRKVEQAAQHGRASEGFLRDARRSA